MATSLASDTVAHARALIRAGSVGKGAWSFSADDGNAILGKDGEDWSAYGLVHLGRDYSAPMGMKGDYKYPIIKGGKVYLAGLRAAISRAAQQHDTSIETAARGLLHLAEDKSAVKDSVWFDAAPSSFGWSVGDVVAYTYRFYNGGSHGYAYGTVTAVHPGGTKNTAKVTIEPAKFYRFGEGKITRSVAKIHHTKMPASAMKAHP